MKLKAPTPSSRTKTHAVIAKQSIKTAEAILPQKYVLDLRLLRQHLVVCLAMTIFLIPSLFVFADEISEAISPLYEDMLVNKVLSLRSRMLDEKALQKDTPFFIVDWTAGGEKMGVRLRMAVEKKRAKVSSLHYVSCPPCDAQTGVIVVEMADLHVITGLEEAVRFLAQPGRSGFLMAIVPGGFQPSTLEPLLKESGLQIEDVFAEPDIEFVHNQAGRQIIHLDDSDVLSPVYQRLVYEGMNPVTAWPAAQRAAQVFRASNRKVLVLKRS